MLSERIPDWEPIPEALRKRKQWVCWRAVDAGDSADGISLTPVEPATGEHATSMTRIRGAVLRMYTPRRRRPTGCRRTRLLSYTR